MKKITVFLLCLLLLAAMAVPAHADDTVTPSEEGTALQEDKQEKTIPPDGPPAEGEQQDDPHEHSHVLISDTATCTNAGIATYRCSCGDEYTRETSATGNHVYSDWTAGENGKHVKTCSGCGGTEEADHSFGEMQNDPATDSHFRVCSVCRYEQKTAHSWGSATVIKKPTCKEEGTMGYYCSGCDFVLVDEDPIPKLTTHTYDSACDPKCNVCEKERAINHTFEKVWSKDKSGHWHACTKCGEKSDFEQHLPGSAATEEKEQVCQICTYVIAPKKTHTHNYGAEWASDEVGHWHACTGCKAEKDYASHAYDDDCDSDCNTCGRERENGHTYDQEGWQVSNFEHWNICSVCGEESKHEKHIAGPEATDEAAQVCTVCNYELAPILVHSHAFGPEYQRAQNSHWQECECGEQSVPEPHIWDEGRENGNKTITYFCTVCGAKNTEEAPGSGVSWITVLLIILAVICAGGIAVLVFMLKRGNFEDDSDDSEEEAEDSADMEEYADQDAEEKLIDDYFSSLDERKK